MKSNKSCYSKMSICNLSMSLGLAFGFGMLVLAYLAMWLNVGVPIVTLVSSLYLGYKATLMGGLIGFAWGFVDGFIFGMILALSYNFLNRKCPCKYCKDGRCGKECAY